MTIEARSVTRTVTDEEMVIVCNGLGCTASFLFFPDRSPEHFAYDHARGTSWRRVTFIGTPTVAELHFCSLTCETSQSQVPVSRPIDPDARQPTPSAMSPGDPTQPAQKLRSITLDRLDLNADPHAVEH